MALPFLPHDQIVHVFHQLLTEATAAPLQQFTGVCREYMDQQQCLATFLLECLQEACAHQQ